MADIFAMVDTWNNGATTFTAIKMNVTNTASAAGSLLMDLQVGGVSIEKTDKNGKKTIADVLRTGPGSAAVPAWGFETGDNDLGFYRSSANVLGVIFGSADAWRMQAAQLHILTSNLSWGSVAGTADLTLTRDAANTLAQRNGTAAQTHWTYNTFTNSSNHERGGFDWITTVNTFRVRSDNAGTGVNRIIAIDGFSKAGAAVAGDIPAGTWALVRDTSGSTTKLIYNNAGTLMSVALT